LNILPTPGATNKNAKNYGTKFIIHLTTQHAMTHTPKTANIIKG